MIGQFRPRRRNKGAGINTKEWVEHFRKLLGAEEIVITEKNMGNRRRENTTERNVRSENERDLDGLNIDISEEELEWTLGKMEKGKAAGEDGLLLEFLKNLPKRWQTELTGIVNGIFGDGRIMKGLETARIFLIHKRRDESEVLNYRGVSFLDVGYKILINLMASTLRKWLENNKIIGESQAGYRIRGI